VANMVVIVTLFHIVLTTIAFRLDNIVA